MQRSVSVVVAQPIAFPIEKVVFALVAEEQIDKAFDISLLMVDLSKSIDIVCWIEEFRFADNICRGDVCKAEAI